MPAADSIPREDRDLVKRLSVVIILGFGFLAAFFHLNRLYSHKFLDVTGRAEWIWPEHRVSVDLPVAFFATRELDLPPQRVYTKLKILGDPEYTLYFNGIEIGGRRVRDDHSLDVYDLSTLAKNGKNRIVVAVRATRGVGGLLVAVDIAPEVENWVVSGDEWRIYRRWTSDIVLRDPVDIAPDKPMSLGEPPAQKWNYLVPQPGELTKPVKSIAKPKATWEVRAGLPTVRIVSGVAVRGIEPVRATVYDFGYLRGRLRLTAARPSRVSRIVNVRFANFPEEVQWVDANVRSFVFAGGEPVLLDVDERQFRYVIVYARAATAEVALTE